MGIQAYLHSMPCLGVRYWEGGINENVLHL
jgi:hypothetical protein